VRLSPDAAANLTPFAAASTNRATTNVDLGANLPVIIQEEVMAWQIPRIIEIAVGLEINCYVCAEL
jgi:coenzyme PQQ precursor peptide PqqA